MDRHVFISYRRSDSGVVDELLAALSGRHVCWRDTAHIAGGQVWRERLARALDTAYAMILVVSPETEHSKEVYAEYFYALGHNVPIIPLLINPCELPWGLEIVNARLWYRDRQRAVRELRGDLDLYHQRAPALGPTNDIHTYLNALQLGYLMNVGNYTPMAGEGRFRPERVVRRPQAVVMRPEFSLRRSNPLFGDRQIEDQRKEYDDLLPALHEAKRVVVLGEPGIGKTTTLYKFADELRLRALENDSAPLPLIIPLREWRGDITWESLIARHLGVLAPRYDQLLASQRLFFLLDGLNEMPKDEQRSSKLDRRRKLLENGAPAIVTCRELDYRDESLKLDLDTILIHPLDPERVFDFIRRYLGDARAQADDVEAFEEMFWQIAGGADVKAVWEKWRTADATLNQFFTAVNAPHGELTGWEDEVLRQKVVRSPANLIHLTANPYLLWMCLQIYLEAGTIPSNRGALFDEFVFQLLKREGLALDDKLSAEGQRLSARLEDLAWTMQRQAVESHDLGSGVELTISRPEAISILGGEERVYRAASANLLEDAEPVRFTHQLMQEYFAARRMVDEIRKGRLKAQDLWPVEQWWQPSGWEEAAVLAVGMSGKEAEKIVRWLLPANPEVAALAVQRSGAEFSDQFKLKFREEWLPQMTDLNRRHPKAHARAAIGRALGSVSLSTGEPLDNRPGVGLTSDGIPDIDWIDITGGTVTLEDVEDNFTVKPFRIARFLVTNRQFQAFVDAPDGYDKKKWWKEIVRNPAPSSPEWEEFNHPRERVSWYEAVAFCRWLSEKYHQLGLLDKGREIRLPTEWEWQQAATNGNPDNVYPWGDSWDSTLCNNSASALNRTSAVGLYPHGTWPGGPLDMAGNLWEWCLNEYENLKGRDATKIDKSGVRVIRGGSWLVTPVTLRSSLRGRYYADLGLDIGFRLAQDIS
jgi:hypothetical protein